MQQPTVPEDGQGSETRDPGAPRVRTLVFGTAREFLVGARFLARGFRLWTGSPRLMLLGMGPAFVVGIFYVAALVVLVLNLPTMAAWLTPFAAEWRADDRDTAQAAAAAAMLVLAILVAQLVFVTITLIVGTPVYRRIWRTVETNAGGPPTAGAEPVLRGLARAARESLRLLLAAAAIGLVLFVGEFLPYVGQLLMPVLAVAVGGWFITVEFTRLAFDARGFTLRARNQMLGFHRARTLGFGIATFLLFLLPFGTMIAMPAAVAGATLLSRSLLPPGALGTKDAPGIPDTPDAPNAPDAPDVLPTVI